MVRDPRAGAERDLHFMHTYWRLKAGVTLAQAQADMAAIDRRLAEQYPAEEKERKSQLVPLHGARGSQARSLKFLSRARFGGVGPRHSIDEPDEQRGAIFGGAWGEKGAGQGEHRSVPHSPATVRGRGVYQGLSGVRGATLFVTHPRWEPYAGKPLVRICAGGDQRWSSLPQHLGPDQR